MKASINAMKASAGAIRKNTFTIREVSLYRIFTSEIWGENGRILPGLKGNKRATQRVMGPFFEKKRNGQRKRRNKGMYEFEKR